MRLKEITAKRDEARIPLDVFCCCWCWFRIG